jgi:HTH domain
VTSACTSAPTSSTRPAAPGWARCWRRRTAAALGDCRYRAVVDVDVSGFVACTTEADRAAIRDSLGIVVDAAPTGSYGPARSGAGPVSHEAVLTARTTHPKDTCQQLAERLGCSTSTIKRHLRRARAEAAQADVQVAPSPRRVPTVDDVLDAFDTLDAARLA